LRVNILARLAHDHATMEHTIEFEITDAEGAIRAQHSFDIPDPGLPVDHSALCRANLRIIHADDLLAFAARIIRNGMVIGSWSFAREN
jgi:hypothetical protein